jgi:hypothetical protein
MHLYNDNIIDPVHTYSNIIKAEKAIYSNKKWFHRKLFNAIDSIIDSVVIPSFF